MTDKRSQKALHSAWIGIVGNSALAVLKGIAGMMTNSKVLVADAAYSASEAIKSFIVFNAKRAKQLQPEEGRSNREGQSVSVSYVVVSVLLLFVGLEIAFDALKALGNQAAAPPKSFALIAIGISIFVKEAMYQYKIRKNRGQSSQEQIAYTKEHRSGMLASTGALAGVLGAILGQYAGLPMLYYLDPAAAIFVAFMLLKLGYGLVKQAFHQTNDRPLQHENTADLLDTVQSVKGVITVDDLRAREQGHYVIVDIIISVNPRITVSEGQDIARTVRQHLMKRHQHVVDVQVQVNPYDAGFPYKNNIDSEQDEFPTLVH